MKNKLKTPHFRGKGQKKITFTVRNKKYQRIFRIFYAQKRKSGYFNRILLKNSNFQVNG